MRQSLKIGFVALVVAAMAAGGLAFAQTDGTDDSVPPTDDSQVEEIVPGAPQLGLREKFEGRRGHHGMRGGPGHLGRVADILGVDADVIRDELEAGGTLADIAAANGSSGSALVEELVADLSNKLDEAVAADRITQERADEVLAEASAKITTLVNSTQEEIQAARDAERAERQAEREARRVERQDTLASVIGIPFEDIQAALEDGETLAEIAAEGPNALSVDELVAGLIAPVADDLQAKVADGTLTREQADERLAEITARMTERVQAVPGDRAGIDGHRGRHGRCGGPGFGDRGGFGGGFGGGFDIAPADEVSLSA